MNSKLLAQGQGKLDSAGLGGTVAGTGAQQKMGRNVAAASDYTDKVLKMSGLEVRGRLMVVPIVLTVLMQLELAFGSSTEYQRGDSVPLFANKACTQNSIASI